MKKLLIVLAVITATLTAYAGNYSYLTFVTTDGAKMSVAASSLTMTISGTTLNAGNRSFTLANLSRMYFSSSDHSTAIESLTAEEWDDVTEIYDLNGRKVTRDMMNNGVYVVKGKRGTFKIAVK